MAEYEFVTDFHRNRFTHQDGLAYTEDGVLVYTLHLPLVRICNNKHHCISLKLSDISAYFEKYGPVVSVNLDSVKLHRIEYQCAALTFENAEDAWKALEETAHSICGYELEGLSPADSWKQQFSEEIIRRKRETYKGPLNAQESPIFGLNDDCLVHLYSFLGLSDAYKVSKLSERFEKAFEATFPSLHKKICIKRYSNMTLLEWRQILKQYGHLIEQFDILGIHEKCRFMEYVPIFCPNLKTFTLHEYSPFSTNFFRNIVSNLKSLHTIELTNPSIDDDIVLVLSRMDSIESLTLYSNKITGLHLDSFQCLRNLKIYDCSALNPLLLIKVFEKVTTLTKLEFYDYNAISNEVIEKLAEFCGNLRELTIYGANCNIEPLARLANLECLYIAILNQISDNFFLDFVPNLKNKLRVLRLDLKQNCLTDAQKECILKLPVLEELYIWNTTDHRGVDEQFLANISTLKNLKTLETDLCSSVQVKAIVDFIRNAPQLEMFAICNPPTTTRSAVFTCFLVLSVIEMLRAINRKSKKPFQLAFRHDEREFKEITSAHTDLIQVTEY